MRGNLTSQPLKHHITGDYLLWNGEIFGGIEVGAKLVVTIDPLALCICISTGTSHLHLPF